MTIEIAEDHVTFDLSGSDRSAACSVNTTYAMAFSACAYALRALLDPDLPMNDGFYRLAAGDRTQRIDRQRAPAGGDRRRLGDRRAHLSRRPFARCIDARRPAGRGFQRLHVQYRLRGRDPRTGQLFVFYEAQAAVMAAAPRKTAWTRPAAYAEHRERPGGGDRGELSGAIERYELIEDSEAPVAFAAAWACGATTARGRVRSRCCPIARASRRRGLCEGLPARPAHFVQNPSTAQAGRTDGQARPGEVFSVQMAGGGGFGPVLERDPQRILEHAG